MPSASAPRVPALRSDRLRRSLAPIGGLVVLLAMAGSAAAACTAVAGAFTSVGVLGPPCTSPILLCTDGTLTGDLEGGYFFTMESLAPALAPDEPTLMVLTGSSAITPADGTMQGEDVGKLWLQPAGPSPFVTIVRVRSGTGAWEGVSGVIVAEGELDLVANQAAGTYSAVLCRG